MSNLLKNNAYEINRIICKNLFTAYLKFGRLCKAVKMLTLNIMQIYEE